MEGLITFLLFGAFFYWMMRFGCGAHMVHGHSQAGHGGAHQSKPAIDPVCGVEVPAGQGYAVMRGGREYRFCSRECLDQFEARPATHRSANGGQS